MCKPQQDIIIKRGVEREIKGEYRGCRPQQSSVAPGLNRAGANVLAPSCLVQLIPGGLASTPGG